jgi:hypothetical protein
MRAHKYERQVDSDTLYAREMHACISEKTNRMVRKQQAEAACLRRCFGRQAKLDAAIAANLKELGYGRRCSLR